MGNFSCTYWSENINFKLHFNKSSKDYIWNINGSNKHPIYDYCYYGSTAFRWALAVSWSYTQSVGPLDGRSGRRKAATYTQNDMNIE
jgi:hypothetical protein